jgi:hypothetical protein
MIIGGGLGRDLEIIRSKAAIGWRGLSIATTEQ